MGKTNKKNTTSKVTPISGKSVTTLPQFLLKQMLLQKPAATYNQNMFSIVLVQVGKRLMRKSRKFKKNLSNLQSLIFLSLLKRLGQNRFRCLRFRLECKASPSATLATSSLTRWSNGLFFRRGLTSRVGNRTHLNSSASWVGHPKRSMSTNKNLKKLKTYTNKRKWRRAILKDEILIFSNP